MTERRTCSNGCDKPVHADGKCNTCYARDLRADTTRTAPSDPTRDCDRCGRPHVTRYGGPSCIGHLSAKNPRDPSGPCTAAPVHGLTICKNHGVNEAARDAGRRRVATRNAEAALKDLIPDNPEPIRDPIATLARLGGEADAVRRNIVDRLNTATDLDAIMAWSGKYQEFLTLTGRFCEALVKSNYLERHAAIEEAQTVAFLAVISNGLRLISDPTERDAVKAAIVNGLRDLQAA